MTEAYSVLSAIAQEFGLAPDALTDRSQRRATQTITAAIAAAAIALGEAGYSQRNIARILNRGRTTIQHHQHSPRYETITILEDYRRAHHD